VLAAIALHVLASLVGGQVAFVLGLGFQPLISSKAAARIYRFEGAFPGGARIFCRAPVRAGHAFSAGMKMVADELDDPVGPDSARRSTSRTTACRSRNRSTALADRIPLLDVKFFATAVLIQRETGGNLAEFSTTSRNVVRERFKIRRQVRVHTAHGRFTGYVLMALPAFLAVALMFINPGAYELCSSKSASAR
jgi:tight adherence protein B